MNLNTPRAFGDSTTWSAPNLSGPSSALAWTLLPFSVNRKVIGAYTFCNFGLPGVVKRVGPRLPLPFEPTDHARTLYAKNQPASGDSEQRHQLSHTHRSGPFLVRKRWHKGSRSEDHSFY